MNEKAAAASKESILTKGTTYLSESVEELKKIHTPTRQETVRLTWVVLIIVLFISLCLFVLDLVFNWIMTKMVA